MLLHSTSADDMKLSIVLSLLSQTSRAVKRPAAPDDPSAKTPAYGACFLSVPNHETSHQEHRGHGGNHAHTLRSICTHANRTCGRGIIQNNRPCRRPTAANGSNEQHAAAHTTPSRQRVRNGPVPPLSTATHERHQTRSTRLTADCTCSRLLPATCRSGHYYHHRPVRRRRRHTPPPPLPMRPSTPSCL